MSIAGNRDERIRELHSRACGLFPQLESIIDELKILGPHSIDGDNARMNVGDWLKMLAKRVEKGVGK